MLIALIVVGVVLLAGIVLVWLIKRKLASMAEGLPDTLQQWEKEMEKLEKPKG